MSVPVKAAVFGPFWEKKFLSFFKKMNLAGDGKIKRSDYEGLADRYIEVGKLDGVKAKQVKRKLVKIWDDYLSQDSINDEISEQAFLQSIRDRKERILETALQFMGLLFDLIDLNGDGVIHLDEYSIFLKVFRVEDENEIKKAFDVIDTNGNGQLSHDEFVYAGCEYFMTNDESLPSSFLFGPLI